MKLTRKVAFILANTLAGKGVLPEESLLKLIQVHNIARKPLLIFLEMSDV